MWYGSGCATVASYTQYGVQEKQNRNKGRFLEYWATAWEKRFLLTLEQDAIQQEL